MLEHLKSNFDIFFHHLFQWLLIQKVIQKYPQIKPDDFSFRSSDKITEEGNEDYLNEE